jgi:hypothetical protein
LVGEFNRPELDAMGDRALEFQRNLEGLQAIAGNPEAVIAFGGHFNSGKSTLLNYLLQRELLPIAQLQETGVASWLRTGARDVGQSFAVSGEVSGISCDSAQISAATSLYTHAGERRERHQFPARLELTLGNACVPENAVWIDSPGINDTSEMDAVALQAALAADVLVWVVNTRQCLAAPEVDFLQRFVERRGAASVAFVINAFLERDDEDTWATFQRRELPIHVRRIAQNAAQMGFGDALPAPLVLSARAAQATDGGFGGRELRNWVQALSRVTHPTIVAGRLHRITRAVDEHRKPVQAEIVKCVWTMNHEAQQLASYQARIAARRAFSNRSRELLDKSIEDFGKSALEAARYIASEINADTLVRDSQYESRLNSKLSSLARGRAYCDEIDRAASAQALTSLTSTARRSISELLTAPAVSVTVADAPLNKSLALKAAAAGAGGGFFIPLVGSLVGGIGGYLAGNAVALKQKRAADAATTQERVEAAARQSKDILSSRRVGILNIVEDTCLGRDPAAPPHPNGSRASSLHALHDGYGRALDILRRNLLDTARPN